MTKPVTKAKEESIKETKEEEGKEKDEKGYEKKGIALFGFKDRISISSLSSGSNRRSISSTFSSSSTSLVSAAVIATSSSLCLSSSHGNDTPAVMLHTLFCVQSHSEDSDPWRTTVQSTVQNCLCHFPG